MTDTIERLTSEEADRAIYIDFEGLPGEPPALLGHVCQGQWKVELFDGSLWSTIPYGVTGGEIEAALPVASLNLIRIRAQRENRRVCAWSQHEIRVIRELLVDDPYLLDWWEANLVNIRKQSVRFVKNRQISTEPIINRNGRPSIGHQAVIMKALDFKVPEEYGRGIAADGITSTRAAIERRQTFARVTPKEKQRWIAMLLHNRYDCFGMAAIMRQVTRGLGHRLPAHEWRIDPTGLKRNPQRGAFEKFIEPMPPLMTRFVGSWMNREFFHGPIFTTQGWYVAEFHRFDSGFQMIVPDEPAPSLLETCERAAIRNLALGLEPARTWHPDDL